MVGALWGAHASMCASPKTPVNSDDQSQQRRRRLELVLLEQSECCCRTPILVGHLLGAERHFEADIAYNTEIIVVHGMGEERQATLVQPWRSNAEGQRTDRATLAHRLESGACAGRITGGEEDECVSGLEACSVDADSCGHTRDNGVRDDGEVRRRGRR